jgi:hypothetical protein
MNQRIYLNKVSFTQNDQVKKRGAKFCFIKKRWFILETDNITKFSKWLSAYFIQQHLERANNGQDS